MKLRFYVEITAFVEILLCTIHDHFSLLIFSFRLFPHTSFVGCLFRRIIRPRVRVYMYIVSTFYIVPLYPAYIVDIAIYVNIDCISCLHSSPILFYIVDIVNMLADIKSKSCLYRTLYHPVYIVDIAV